jgi:competence protein ComGC
MSRFTEPECREGQGFALWALLTVLLVINIFVFTSLFSGNKKKNQLFDLVVEGQGSNGLDFIRDVKS